MSQSDPIADFITVVRNGVRAHMETIEAPYSKMKAAISEILASEGFIEGWEEIEVANRKGNKFKRLRLTLRYADPLNTISPLNKLERVSTPGRRVYVGRRELPTVRGGFGISILSTSRGVMSDKQARKHNLGGELLV
ncbi:30S ribosomal protein S8, partial [bacterium]|nr:30S ribosomal protein S8 [bacterium]